MKHVLLVFVLVIGQSALAADEKLLITDPVVEEAIGKLLIVPYGKFAPQVKLTEADLEKVTELDFRDRTKISDAGLKEVVKLTQLESLYLHNTQITDAGLKEVAKLNQLTFLNLKSTKIKKADVVELKKALPKCDIFY